MEARDLINSITFEARNDMTQEAYIMTEDEKYLMPFEVFLHNGRVVLKPIHKKYRAMMGIRLDA